MAHILQDCKVYTVVQYGTVRVAAWVGGMICCVRDVRFLCFDVYFMCVIQHLSGSAYLLLIYLHIVILFRSQQPRWLDRACIVYSRTHTGSKYVSIPHQLRPASAPSHAWRGLALGLGLG